MKKYIKGFTLVEIMIAISIIAIIVTATITSYTATQKNARDGRRKTDLESIRQALELYRTDNNEYPAVGGGGWIEFNENNFGTGVLVPDYIDRIPVDPKPDTTDPYKYKATNVSVGNYYGYCLETVLENETPATNPCAPEPSPAAYNFTVKNP